MFRDLTVPPWDDAEAWGCWQGHWALRAGTIYLNHGSFGPPPRAVQAARQAWQWQLDAQPMDLFVRRFAAQWFAARSTLAAFVGAAAEDVILVENATAAMNLVAAHVVLRPGDEVVLTDHEYGAVRRIWERACRRAGTAGPVTAVLPPQFESADQVVDTLFAAVHEHTKLVVVSHITSPTAVILPVLAICREARRRGIAVCVDGPHAIAQLPLEIAALDCDFYAASCHKWLSAPFGSGFLAVHPRQQAGFEPVLLSWGRLPPESPRRWSDEHIWTGTRDPSGFFAVPDAIGFLRRVGLPAFRDRTHALAQYARERIGALTGLTPPVPDSPTWYGSMVSLPLPPLDAPALQRALSERDGIEVPVMEWAGQLYLRVSCHLYNTPGHIQALCRALRRHL
jgi:isopenicillin-N epimerase